MATRIHPHAQQRLAERGATEAEVLATVPDGGSFPAKMGRTGFRRNFPFGGKWWGKYYANKQVIAYAVREQRDWLVITVITKFF
ncbi:MAG: DUF4258 domain-containing protein [Verrucomicrobiae bacterium]|nr:DUF4258 domain-containing protein [Verrucomicrobiae bacterium]